MSNKITWNEENTQKLAELAGTGEVSQADLVTIAEAMGTTARSIGAKLRKMGYEVAKAVAKAPSWTEAQEAELRGFVEGNPNQYTYSQIAEAFQNGAFTAKQVQGKLLNMELFGLVKKAEKKAAPRTYTPEEEIKFIELAGQGASIETLASTFNKTVASVRGKALSLLRAEQISEMPKQEHSTAKDPVDLFKGLEVSEMTIEQLVEATGKTVRGLKSILSRRGITCVDYDGAQRREKLDSGKAA